MGKLVTSCIITKSMNHHKVSSQAFVDGEMGIRMGRASPLMNTQVLYIKDISALSAVSNWVVICSSKQPLELMPYFFLKRFGFETCFESLHFSSTGKKKKPQMSHNKP